MNDTIKELIADLEDRAGALGLSTRSAITRAIAVIRSQDEALDITIKERDEAYERIDVMKDALAPFAEAYEFAQDGEQDMVLTTNDLKRAYEAYSASELKGPGQ